MQEAIRRGRRELGAGAARLRIFRGHRGAALRVLAAREPLDDRTAPVVVATFTGPIDYRKAIAGPGDATRVTGRFAYLMLDPRSGELLELGVQRRVPAKIRGG